MVVFSNKANSASHEDIISEYNTSCYIAIFSKLYIMPHFYFHAFSKRSMRHYSYKSFVFDPRIFNMKTIPCAGYVQQISYYKFEFGFT